MRSAVLITLLLSAPARGEHVQPTVQLLLRQLGPTDRLSLTVVNRSPSPVVFIRPEVAGVSAREDSEVSYRFIGRDEAGHRLAGAPEAVVGARISSKSTSLLRPGERLSLRFDLPEFWGRPDRLRLEYRMTSEMRGELHLPDPVPPALATRLRQLFVGQLLSNEIRLKPASKRHAPLVVPRKPRVMGPLDRAIIERSLFGKREALMRCLVLRRSLGPLPAAYSATVHFVITADRRTLVVDVKSPRVVDLGLAGCLRGWIEKITFPGHHMVVIDQTFDIYSR